jgi:hypothetical protein
LSTHHLARRAHRTAGEDLRGRLPQHHHPTVTSSRPGKKHKTIPGKRIWGMEMRVMRHLLRISPRLRNNIILMIASRTTIQTYGNRIYEVLASLPINFLERVQHLRLKITYPASLDDTFLRSPRLRVVEVGLDLLTFCEMRVEIKTSETFSGFSEIKTTLRFQELVIEYKRSVLKRNFNECVHRALDDQQRKFTLLVRGSFRIVPVDE